jgi:ATP-dependent Clp protease ATP-binding subunit ClpX
MEVTPGAMKAIASEAMHRNTGARALRSILEEVMLDVMYDIPSMPDVVKVIIDADCITQHKTPTIVTSKEVDVRRSA